MLKSIEQQGHFGEYELIICDNHSDYSVKEFVLSSFDSVFTDNIFFNSWRFNTGQSTNMAISFLLVKTKWCWYLSDDDEITNNSLGTVLNDIKRFSDIAAIKHSIEGFVSHPNIQLNSIRSFIDYYKNGNKGEMIFLSMVYNLDILKPWLGLMTMYSYTYMSYLIPVIKSLNEGVPIALSSFEAYKYKKNSEGWSGNTISYLNTLLGIRTFYDIPLDLSSKERDELNKLICFLCNPQNFTNNILAVEDKFKRRNYYNLLRSYCYRDIREKILYGAIFALYDKFGVNIKRIKTKRC